MLDLDCEVQGSLDPLFRLAREGCAVARDPHDIDRAKDAVQSGVVACSHGHPLPPAWAAAVLPGWRAMHSDQTALNEVIGGFRNAVQIMPREYHWLRLDGVNPPALIMQWTGPDGKAAIRNRMDG